MRNLKEVKQKLELKEFVKYLPKMDSFKEEQMKNLALEIKQNYANIVDRVFISSQYKNCPSILLYDKDLNVLWVEFKEKGTINCNNYKIKENHFVCGGHIYDTSLFTKNQIQRFFKEAIKDYHLVEIK